MFSKMLLPLYWLGQLVGFVMAPFIYGFQHGMMVYVDARQSAWSRPKNAPLLTHTPFDRTKL